MPELTGKTVAATYKSLLNIAGDTGALVAGAAGSANGVQVKTGNDDLTPIYLNTDRIGIGTNDAEALFEVRNGETLGSSLNDSVLISQVSGYSANWIKDRTWALRDLDTGANWYSYRIHQGISVDGSYGTPRTNTKCWHERDAYSNIFEWGSSSTSYMTLSGGNLGIGETAPDKTLHVKFNTAYDGLKLENTITGPGSDGRGASIEMVDGDGDGWKMEQYGHAANRHLNFYALEENSTHRNHVLCLLDNGQISMGTSVPVSDSKLELWSYASGTCPLSLYASNSAAGDPL